MKKLIISYSITPETYLNLKCMSERAGISASSLIDQLVEKEWQKCAINGDLPQPKTETPAGE